MRGKIMVRERKRYRNPRMFRIRENCIVVLSSFS
jgi:hypothetical protein